MPASRRHDVRFQLESAATVSDPLVRKRPGKAGLDARHTWWLATTGQRQGSSDGDANNYRQAALANVSGQDGCHHTELRHRRRRTYHGPRAAVQDLIDAVSHRI